MRPWINKKIIEYIGEEEPTLVDFVCSKVFLRCVFILRIRGEETLNVMFVWCFQVMAHSAPQSILDDVAMVSTSHRNMSSALSLLHLIFYV